MKSETDPITNDEWLLRRFYQDRFKNDRVPKISSRAFEPRITGRDPDVDGISLYRESCLSSPGDILAPVTEDKRPEQGIVRIQVKTLHDLGLTVTSKPDPLVQGHVVIPQINSIAYAAAKSDFTSLLLNLATEVSRDENILLTPRELQ